jgi:hypothetical protein
MFSSMLCYVFMFSSYNVVLRVNVLQCVFNVLCSPVCCVTCLCSPVTMLCCVLMFFSVLFSMFYVLQYVVLRVYVLQLHCVACLCSPVCCVACLKISVQITWNWTGRNGNLESSTPSWNDFRELNQLEHLLDHVAQNCAELRHYKP